MRSIILLLSALFMTHAAHSASSPSEPTPRPPVDLQLRLTGNWGWLGADLNNNPVQRAFTDDLVERGASTWKFGYLVAQLQARSQLRSGWLQGSEWACVLQLKHQQRGADPFTQNLRDTIELDLGFCALERQSPAGHTLRLAAGEKQFAFGLKPADVPLLDVFPERAGVVYGESARRRTSGGMVEASFAPALPRHELEILVYYVYDFRLGYSIQTQAGAELNEITTDAYGLQLLWRPELPATPGALSLALGARQTAHQSTENLLIGVPEQTELIASAEWVRGPWTTTWETVYSDILNYNEVPGQLDEQRLGSYLELSRSTGRWALAVRASYAWARQSASRTGSQVDPRLQPHPGLLPFLPFSYDPVEWEAGAAVSYALHEQLHLKASVTTGDYGYLSGVAFTPAGELALFRDAGQDTHYTLTVGFGLDQAWRWLRGRE